jgi:DNA-directed RNA polymerase subunit M/transcription elongation factor TFIIS
MNIRFQCEHCGAVVRAPETAAGKRAACPECRRSVDIPAAGRSASGSADDLYEIMPAEDAPRRPASTRGPEQPSVALPTGPMLHVRFECPTCLSIIKAPRTVAGKKSHCPNCGELVRIPVPQDDDESPIEIVAEAENRPLELKLETADGPGPDLPRAADQPETHIRFQCTHCGSTIKAPKNTAGKKSGCPKCGNRVRIPVPEDQGDSDDLFEVETTARATSTPLTYTEAVDERSRKIRIEPGRIRFECPHCGSVIKAPATVAGKKSKCPSCGRRVIIPTDDPTRMPSGEIAIVEPTAKRRAYSGPVILESDRAGNSTAAPANRLPIRFSCPHCGSIIKCPPQYEGKKSSCPNCQERLRIPKAPSLDEPQPIELLNMSPEEERKMLDNLSRQTRGSSISGVLLMSDTSDDGRKVEGGVVGGGPLTSSDEIPKVQRPKSPTRSGKSRTVKPPRPPTGKPPG